MGETGEKEAVIGVGGRRGDCTGQDPGATR